MTRKPRSKTASEAPSNAGENPPSTAISEPEVGGFTPCRICPNTGGCVRANACMRKAK